MGRGRAKAKQTKVARQLKYNSGGTDLARLAEELGASSTQPAKPEHVEDDELNDDPYARYADLYNDEDDEDEESQHHSSQRRRA
ncbi:MULTISPECIES: DUF3073 domain-containing protein [Streptomycetaceae]|uniref:DUF3073 domain-containing protein n=1 Tax=Streptantibioticus cattleyicolor (strain ATCC 35852 / DSM 46488 / JCM 4925 / NBRC 14057 / NRRL 8057) TaxID=1003195 RepID=F8JVL7_STREN|nr:MULTISPECIES: DUF3073 domain-containing protein [Streptomycetaceae]AEW95716.1 hypothetical protein SCATT_33450 [Streptantibioticus cattleyicolor NRRL 8057 = DSM 46488]MYS60262.1 DUF3073 family protein [Streptomyces sp. SID5468]CCB76055.1 conserved protein of unknown function [Streptantibioticus cattleyicolor NRRL 8057 = DSM 46488]